MARWRLGKARGQIDKLKTEFESNGRLSSVFSICQDLNIDDPIHWMNNTKPIVVDWWIAYRSFMAEQEQRIRDEVNNEAGQEMSANSAMDYISERL